MELSKCASVTRVVMATAVLSIAVPCAAQVTPAAGYVPPDDTPSIRVGATIYADYTYQQAPKIKDADGNVLETHDSLSLCPNVMTGIRLEEGPSGRDL